MADHLQSSIVRISSPDGTVVGAGFLVGEHHILTCAHVVASALGIPAEAQEATGSVPLNFPFVPSTRTLSARVNRWHPVRSGSDRHGEGGEDIAVLILDEDPPEGSRPARLVLATDLWGHSFRTFGFPAGYDDGVWASGVLRATQSTGWLQIEDVKTTGYSVEPGFSGAPVWDEQMEGVVGMVVAADRRSDVRAAFIQSTAMLTHACPELGPQTIPPCPYRGLSSFREEDARYFFGRAAFVAQLYQAAQQKALVLVIGPSGSGKSSAVAAGLLPRLRAEGNVTIASMCPGAHPLHALASALVPLLEEHMTETERLGQIPILAEMLAQGHVSLADVAARITDKHAPAERIALVIDQLEEMYTLCKSTEEHQHFLDVLLSGIGGAEQRVPPAVVIILTMRADFVGHLLAYRPMTDALQSAARPLLGPMTRSELRAAIEEPARALKVNLEDGLTDRILDAVDEGPGDLPLVEFALTSLWPRQHNGTLTHEAYDEIGGVEQALSNHAEAVFGGLTEEEQRRAQRIFVQLVQPGDGTRDTRRVASRAEIGESDWNLVARLADARLVVSGRGENTVELVHDALIDKWKRLQGWVEADRKFRVWQEELRGSLKRWESRGRDDSLLLRGVLLHEARIWLAERGGDLSETECRFLQASETRDEQELAAERERQQREQENVQRLASMERRRADLERALPQSEDRRLRDSWILWAVTACIALLALGLRIFPFMMSDELNVYDSFMAQMQPSAPAQIAVIAINQNDRNILTAYGIGERQAIASAIRNLSAVHPSAIGIDVLYDSTDPQDAALAAAMKRARNVVLPEVISHNNSDPQHREYLGLEGPNGRLASAAAAIAVQNLAGDREDGKVRSLELQPIGPNGIDPSRGQPYPSFALALAGIAQHRSTHVLAAGLPATMRLTYYRQPTEGQITPVVTGDYPRTTLQQKYGGKIVLILDETSSASFDTPVGQMNEGYIQANAVATILQGRPIRSAGDGIDTLVVIMMTILAAGIASRLGLAAGAAGMLLLVALYALLDSLFFFQAHLWLELIVPEVAAVLAFTAVVTLRYAQAERMRQRFQQIFGQYVKPDMIEGVMKAPDEETGLGGARRQISILVVSIRNFSVLTKLMHPEDVVVLLETYLSGATQCVHDFDGTLTKYLGDEVVAMWNAPRYQSDHAALAVAGALRMIERMEAINQQLQARALPPIAYGIGVSTGDAVIGQIGSESRKHYDVVGDPVTSASGLCRRAHGGEILADQSTWENLGGRLDVQEIESLIVEEGNHTVRVFRVIGLKSSPRITGSQAEVVEAASSATP